MHEKFRKDLQRHLKLCIGIGIGIGVSALYCYSLGVAYEAGCQHGVDTVQNVLMRLDYDLCEQVDTLFRENGMF